MMEKKMIMILKQCQPDIPLIVTLKTEMVVVEGKEGSEPIRYELPPDPIWEIPRDSLTLGPVLGEGEFGRVMKAELEVRGVAKTAAVKTLKENHTDAEMIDLVKEMEILKLVRKHRNVINLIGCCTQGGPLYVVDYAPFGNLREFLRNHRPSALSTYDITDANQYELPFSQKTLLDFACQVARGMEYLASKMFIHRDLAARNVLVGNNQFLKIADFGLARNIEQNYYYRKKTHGKVPIKWMAPEALFDRVYTSQSDMWSFGILLWEITTLGGTPYPLISLKELDNKLRGGYRMEKPAACPQDLYQIMLDCWEFKPEARPTFIMLVKNLENMLAEAAGVEYLEISPALEHLPYIDSSVEETILCSALIDY